LLSFPALLQSTVDENFPLMVGFFAREPRRVETSGGVCRAEMTASIEPIETGNSGRELGFLRTVPDIDHLTNSRHSWTPSPMMSRFPHLRLGFAW
jgi:hypothetical protein